MQICRNVEMGMLPSPSFGLYGWQQIHLGALTSPISFARIIVGKPKLREYLRGQYASLAILLTSGRNLQISPALWGSRITTYRRELWSQRVSLLANKEDLPSQVLSAFFGSATNACRVERRCSPKDVGPPVRLAADPLILVCSIRVDSPT